MRCAFVTDELPRPGMAGHLAMNHAIIAWLRSNGHEVTVFLVRPRLRTVVVRYDAAPVVGIGVGYIGRYVYLTSLRAGMAMLGRRILARMRKHQGHGGRLYGQVDEVLGAFVTPKQRAWCNGQMMKLAPDAVFADTIFRAPVLLEPALAQVRRVIIAHDVFHLRHRALRSAGYSISPPELTRETEAGLLNLAHAIAAIQPDEAEMIRALCPEKYVCAAPMPALPCRRPEHTDRIRGRLVFVGSASLPNLDGLRWLFDEIWPRLRAALPHVSLDLVGECGDALAQLPPGVTRLGRVPSLSPVLHRSALAISPLRVGSGLKIKILDYARHGLFTVATRQSLEGFAADDRAPFIAAGDAEGFAEAVAARLAAGNKDGEDDALGYVARHYNVDASFSGLAAALGIAVPEKIEA